MPGIPLYRRILVCYYCGNFVPFQKRTKDHKIPRSRGGGGWHTGNVVMACGECNQAKGILTEVEFSRVKNDPAGLRKAKIETEILYQKTLRYLASGGQPASALPAPDPVPAPAPDPGSP